MTVTYWNKGKIHSSVKLSFVFWICWFWVSFGWLIKPGVTFSKAPHVISSPLQFLRECQWKFTGIYGILMKSCKNAKIR